MKSQWVVGYNFNSIEERSGGVVGRFRFDECPSSREMELMAAAPALLDQLKRLLRVIDRMPSNPADGVADEARAWVERLDR